MLNGLEKTEGKICIKISKKEYHNNFKFAFYNDNRTNISLLTNNQL